MEINATHLAAFSSEITRTAPMATGRCFCNCEATNLRFDNVNIGLDLAGWRYRYRRP
jgi:hypothetical protein